jgi:hypothetical protein
VTDSKISALASGSPAQAGDEYIVARSGANYKLTLTNIAASMPPIGTTTPNSGAFTTLSASGGLTLSGGNLAFTGTAQRITGDFSNATASNRVVFQSNITNGVTQLSAAPNGTGTQSGLFCFDNSDLANNAWAAIRVVASTDARIQSSITGTGSYLPLTFYTGGSEKVRIDTSGNVGIGTASPGTKLDAYSSSTTSTILRTRNDTTSVYLDANNGYSYLNTFTNHPMLFGTNNTERMRIDASGNVGIGGTVTNPRKLELLGNFPSTGTANSNGVAVSMAIPSAITSNARGFYSSVSTQAASFTLTNYIHYEAEQVSLGSGSALTNQYGFLVNSALTSATNNYGFYSNIASGSNRWNFYAAGTARNYFAGNTGIGTVGGTTVRLWLRGEDTTSTNFGIYVENSTPTITFFVRNDGLFRTGTATLSPYNYTTGSAANTFVNSDGDLQRSTSSLRYKTDITDATHGLVDVLKLRSVTYKGKNDGEKVFGGLIAEEVHDAGLTEFVAYDKEGQPDAIHYGNMVALLTKAIQEQQVIIDELKAKVAALEAK